MDPHTAAQTYALACKTLKAEWYYTEPRFTADQSLLQKTATARDQLARLDPSTLDALAASQTAHDAAAPLHSFWINVYNGAVIDQATDMGVQQSVKEVRGFFRRRFLEIAGTSLSLDEIEHGFLRDNRRHPARLLPPLAFRPRLKRWIARPFDPRIHFALNCGARSCPPIGVYTPEAIDAQLELAAESFIDAETTVDAEAQTIEANRILRWYRSDFGDLEELLRRHRSDGLAEQKWRFKWREYDWSV